MAKGLDRRDATLKAMAEITGPVIAITLVLSSVFIPTAFVTGLSGQFYRQFALTIAASTIISAINALTMAPARAVQLIRPREHGAGATEHEALPRLGVALIAGLLSYWLLAARLAALSGISSGIGFWLIEGAVFAASAGAGWFLSPAVNRFLAAFFKAFNRVFELATNRYGRSVGTLLRFGGIALFVYGGLIGLTYLGFVRVPVGFIPPQDKGYLIVNVQLPQGASLDRTDAVVRGATQNILRAPGVDHAVGFSGFSAATRANDSGSGAIFVVLKPFGERGEKLAAGAITASLTQKLHEIQEAAIDVFPPPAVRGLGTAGGFKLYVQDRSGADVRALQETADKLVAAGSQQPGLVGVFTPFRANTPQLYADVDRTKAKMLNVPLSNVFDTLQAYLGSIYVNDFNLFGRTYRVTAQAEGSFRSDANDIAKLKVRTEAGDMVPLGSLIEVRRITGPDRIVRYNMFPAAEINGDSAPGSSSGQAMATIERLAREILPSGFSFEWTDLSYQQILAGNTAIFVFPLCVLFVFLVLAAQYESWSLPLAVILIVPMCLLSAIGGLWLGGMDNNILTQIGFVVLVGLASKNAILIVQFARVHQESGKDRFTAAVEASRLRLRPILMTSFAFILGVLPLVVAEGAGAEMRQSLGTAVFSGMLGVTFFGLFLTPVFYVVIQGLIERRRDKKALARSFADGAKTIGILLLLFIPVAGCMVGPNYKEPAPATPVTFANQDQSGVSTLEPERAWWSGFNDQTLNRLVELALAGNHDLRIAAARLREARALRLETQVDQFPVVTAGGAYTRARESKAVSPPTGDRDIDLVNAGFDASWELDFFGRVRRSVETRTAEVEAADATERDVMVSLLAEIARNYLELRGAQNQLEVARRNAENQRETLNLTFAVLEGGRGTELDTSRAQAQLNATLATIPPLETTIKAASYRLAVLTGQQPTALDNELSKPDSLPELPRMVSLGRPEDLLRRRPDIRIAERNLAAATARIGVATADLFPRVTFVGSIGLEATSFARLGSGGSDTFAFGPRIFWAAFDLGRVRARIQATDAQADAALAQYEQRVLTALEETENALVNFGRQQIRRDYLRESAQASEKATALARLRYQYGVADFLTVLDAERTLLQAQDQLAQSRTSTATALVAVYKALGGGWE
jgi:NodT family efflux transporter outer membrane factor (OMF) lipoprotein